MPKHEKLTSVELECGHIRTCFARSRKIKTGWWCMLCSAYKNLKGTANVE